METAQVFATMRDVDADLPSTGFAALAALGVVGLLWADVRRRRRSAAH
jgi:hypothetical protein